MHSRVVGPISLRDRIDHSLRLLRRGGAVEIMPVLDAGELAPDVETWLDTCGRVHTTLRRALRAASRIASGFLALSHSPMTKPSSSSARALCGSSPRLSA